MRRALGWLLPRRLRGRIFQEIKRQVGLNSNSLLSALYKPLPYPSTANEPFRFDRDKQNLPPYPGSLFPLPPSHLRMGYAPNDDQDYYSSGIKSANAVRKLYNAQGISIEPGDSIMDWGCATGRVLRHFHEEARISNAWGLEQDAPSLEWSKQNLDPPFHFLSCSAYPHLPFPDNTFKLIYGLSVFTHIMHFADLWLMEFRRIMRPGGCAVFSIQDEQSWEHLQKHQPDWVPVKDLERALEHDVVIYGGRGWATTYTFFRRDWVREEWNRYLDVVAVEGMAEGYQTAVVLRKS